MSNAPKPLSVLLVDDEPEILALTAEFLSEEFDVRTAEDGVAALAEFERNPADIIISDQRMPGMTGVELLRESLKIAPDTERIILTAHAELQLVIDCINEAHVSHILTKPVKPEQIVLTARKASESLRLRRENRQLLMSLQKRNQDLRAAVEARTQELQQANVALRKLQETREQMVRIAVHDLKNPLSNLHLALGVLVDSDRRDDRREFGALAQDSINAMDTLVSDMLSVAELDKGSDKTEHRELMAPADMLRASVQAFLPAAQRKNIDLRLDLPDSLPPVSVNETHMREAFDNLISNGIKYTQRGGQVIVRGRLVDDSLELSVSDNGLGMTPEDINSAFGEFQRLSARPTEGESSTGLGLFIVKRIVELHEGRITIHSDGRDKGTSFIITLPVLQPTNGK